MKRYGGWYWYTTEKMNLLEKHKCENGCVFIMTKNLLC